MNVYGCDAIRLMTLGYIFAFDCWKDWFLICGIAVGCFHDELG